MVFLFVISSLSLNTFLLRGYFECKTELEKQKLIGNVFSIIVIFNLLILLLGFLLGPLLVKYAHLQIPFYPYFSISLFINFFEVVSIVPMVIYRVKENARYYVLINVTKSLIIFITTYLLIVRYKWGLSGNFYGRLYVNIIFAIIYILIVYRNAILNLNISQIKKGLKFSLPLLPGAIGYLFISMSDRIILERFVTLSQIGIYSVAYTLAYSVSIVIQSGYRAFEPEIFKQYGSANFKVFIEKIQRVFMFVVFVFAATLSVFAKDVLRIMTKGDFINGYLIIPIILLGVILTAQNAILGSVIIAEKNTKLSSSSTIAGGAVSIIFNLMLVPYYGIYCAAIASFIAYLVMNFIIIGGMEFKTNVFKSDFFAFIIFSLLSIIVTLYISQEKFTFLGFLLKSTSLTFAILLFGFIYKIRMESIKLFLPIFKSN